MSETHGSTCTPNPNYDNERCVEHGHLVVQGRDRTPPTCGRCGTEIPVEVDLHLCDRCDDQGRSQTAFCPRCEPDNPAARYADTCVQHRVEESLPAHYFDCDRFQTYNYGTRQGDCDCTASADFEALLALAAPASRCTPMGVNARGVAQCSEGHGDYPDACNEAGRVPTPHAITWDCCGKTEDERDYILFDHCMTCHRPVPQSAEECPRCHPMLDRA